MTKKIIYEYTMHYFIHMLPSKKWYITRDTKQKKDMILNGENNTLNQIIRKLEIGLNVPFTTTID